MMKYDIVIGGSGAAGISLALELIKPEFRSLNILLLDQEVKNKNDHTWCFWENTEGPYDHILSNKFSKIRFRSKWNDIVSDIDPYNYKMLQADKFYEYARDEFSRAVNLSSVQSKISGYIQNEDGVQIQTESGSIQTNLFFKSFLEKDTMLEPKYFVAQHFKGWFIEAEQAVFDPNQATFMDFSIAQYGETRFFYVLPLTENTALVEIAIFSNSVMNPEAYNPLLKSYISENFPGVSYKIREQEFGVIPMTSYPFWRHNTKNVFHIGGAGGAIKPSSGFAFKRIQEHTAAIINCLRENKPLDSLNSYWKNRYYLYDKTMLDVILVQKYPGDKVFDNLFEHNSPQKILKFLDGHTSLYEEMNIFRKMPIFPFLRGFIRNTLR
jgi:lycopene beta-cyclase